MKQPTDILFFFDTEDFTSETAPDTIIALTDLLEEEGVTGHFAVVGLLAQQLTNWGRDDAKQALARHIVGTHTYGHSLHPNIAEMSDGHDFDAAYNRVRSSEDEGVRLIRDNLGIDMVAFGCPPGNSKSYVAMYAYRDMGIPFLCDSVVYDNENALVEYCGLTQFQYNLALETLFLEKERPDLDAVLDELSIHRRVIIFLHPNSILKTQFWDGLNYMGGNLRPFGDWIEAPSRPLKQTLNFLHDMRMLIRRLKSDERFRITTLPETTRGIITERKPIDRSLFTELAGDLSVDFEPTGLLRKYQASIADVFFASAVLLSGKDEYRPIPVKGFLDIPAGITAPVTVTRGSMACAASAIIPGAFIPAEFHVESIDGTSVKIGPADFLFGAVDLIVKGGDSVELRPREQMPRLPEYQALHNLHMRGTWVNSPDFLDEYVSDRLRLQGWTLRYLE